MRPDRPSTEYRELIERVLSELDLRLDGGQTAQLAAHFSLLVHWNRRINLTSVRRPEDIAVRHFGESLFLVKLARPETGLLVDVGSGAGFPGLPIKIACPAMTAFLLEPTTKKTAFLKEVIRQCKLDGIEARAERLEEAVHHALGHDVGRDVGNDLNDDLSDLAGRVALVTLRAVALTPDLLSDLKKLLVPDGRLALFLGEKDALALKSSSDMDWESPAPIPHSERRVVLLGRKRTSNEDGEAGSVSS